MALDIKCPEYFEEVQHWAAQNGCLLKLSERLDYLRNYAGGDFTCELYKDFAPNSFEFLVKKLDGSKWFNGGLIYSGPGQPLDGSYPALTVSLEPTGRTHQWSIHT